MAEKQEVKKPLFDGRDTFRDIESWVCEPYPLEARKERIKEAIEKSPEFGLMLFYIFRKTSLFQQIKQVWPEDDNIINGSDFGKEFTFQAWAKESINYTDDSPNKNKLSACISTLEYIVEEDAKIILDVIQGVNPLNVRLHQELYASLLGEMLS